MRKTLHTIMALLLATSVAFSQIRTPLSNAVLQTDLDANSKRITNLDVTNLPLQPLDSDLTSISSNGVTATGLAVLNQPDLTSLRAYVGATGTVVNTMNSDGTQFLTGFNSGTGNFTRSAVTYSQVTGKPTPPPTTPPIANKWIDGWDASTGLFSQSQPAFTNISGTATSGQLPATISSKTFDDTNTYNAKDGSFFLENTATPTKKLQFDLSAISAGNTRTVSVPNTNSTLAVPISAVSHQFLTSLASTGLFAQTQPDFTDLSGTATATQVPTLNNIRAPTASVDMNGQKITNLAAPTVGGDAVTKTYTDTAVAAGVPPPHQAVAAATTANVTLSGEQTIDGVLTSASRVLVKNQTTGSENGIYTTAAGAWSRVSDADTGSEIPGLIFVSAGTANGFTGWAATTPLPITIGVTSITYTQTSSVPSYTAGSGLQLSGTQFSVKGSPSRIVVGASGVDIDSGYVGQSSINTLGTITAGTWQGSIVAGAYGGTGVNNTGKTLTLGGNMTTTGVTSLSGTNSGDVTLTGQNYLSISGQQVTANAIDLSGSNVTGTLAAARMPALTGDVTTTAGAVATSLGSNVVTNSKLAQSAANTIKGNNTGSTANVVDMTIAQFKTLTSLTNVENTALSTWAGSSNLTTLGTVTTGTWSGTAVAIAKGGTGASTVAGARSNLLPLTGNSGKTLVVNASGTDVTPVSEYAKQNRVIFTSGSGTYTPSTGTVSFQVELVGAGGGGGGALGGAGASAAGGGASGAYVNKFYSTVAASYIYTVGAAGAGGLAGNNNGSVGGDTTFAALSAPGGGGGLGSDNNTTAQFRDGGNAGTPLGGDLNVTGSAGGAGTRLSGTTLLGGAGGASALAGSIKGSSGSGSNGNFPGGGGAGAGATGSSQHGGDGAGGVIIITENIQTTAP